MKSEKKTFWDDPKFRERLQQWIEASANESEFLPKLKRDALPRPRTIKLPLQPEYSKEPLNAEIVIEDILDADLIG